MVFFFLVMAGDPLVFLFFLRFDQIKIRFRFGGRIPSMESRLFITKDVKEEISC